jgi:hypothetical protein
LRTNCAGCAKPNGVQGCVTKITTGQQCADASADCFGRRRGNQSSGRAL